ncbi:YraN family protein [Desulfobulbus oligotrophicus]|nr:YraN family protein [Desulfobulbus oligotrophicus]
MMKRVLTTVDIGRQGEQLAITFLKRQGYRIVARNYRKSFGEVDIIAQQKNTLVFVEVKTRQSTRFGTPFEAVDCRKQRQLSRIAQDYLQSHDSADVSARFDVIAVRLDRDGGLVGIDHLQNAFECIE